MNRHTLRPIVAALAVLALPSSPSAAQAQRPLAARPAVPFDTAALRRAVDSIAGTARGRLGVGIELLETGERLTSRGKERFPMQSVYKLPVAIATLAAVDRGALRLDAPVTVTPADYVGPGQRSPLRDAHPTGTTSTVASLLALNTSESDGSACDVLFRLLGGPAAVQRYLDAHGIAGIRVRSTEQAIGRTAGLQYENWASPAGALALLRAVHEQRLLSDSAHARLMRLLVETPTGPRRLRGHLPAGTIVAHKTGSSGTVAGVTAATNDIGIITLPDGRHLAVAVLLADSRLEDAAREDVIAAVARAAWDAARAAGTVPAR